MMSINGSKGPGKDALSATILQACEWETAAQIHQIIMLIIANSYRGLLVSDHVGKVLASLLQQHLEPHYMRQVGESQFGAIGARGTGVPSLMLRSFIDICKLFSLSMFVLFVDLSKAFD